jgi:alpha-tubulin suppressor-like RCC1 family protein
MRSMMMLAVMYADVSCGYQHCCGLVADGYGGTAARTVKCWGSNQFGQRDAPTDGTCCVTRSWTQEGESPSAACVPLTERVGCGGGGCAVPFARLYAGATHTCALTLANSTVRCWGNPASLGDESMGVSLQNPFPDGTSSFHPLSHRSTVSTG